MSFNLKNKKCHLKNDKNDHVLQALMTEIAVHRCYLGNYPGKHVCRSLKLIKSQA